MIISALLPHSSFCLLPSPGYCGPGPLAMTTGLSIGTGKRKGDHPDGGFRWPAEALALALGPGLWVLGSRLAGLLGVPEPLSLPSLPVRD